MKTTDQIAAKAAGKLRDRTGVSNKYWLDHNTAIIKAVIEEALKENDQIIAEAARYILSRAAQASEVRPAIFDPEHYPEPRAAQASGEITHEMKGSNDLQ